MNNWTVTLALFLFAISGVFFALWQHEKRTGRTRVLQAFEKEYRTLQVDHGVQVAKADGLEQELERLKTAYDILWSELERVYENENEDPHVKNVILLNEQERGHVDEDTVAPPATQASTQAAPVRNARQRKGAARKEP